MNTRSATVEGTPGRRIPPTTVPAPTPTASAEARLAARPTALGDVARRGRSGGRASHQLPTNTGLRPSRNAATASLRSAVVKSRA